VTLAEIRPVPVLQAGRCADDRYPALAGAWVVGCVGSDTVNVAVSLVDGRVVTLTDPVESPALGDGWLWAPGRLPGAWVLPATARGPLPGLAPLVIVAYPGVSPPAVRRTDLGAWAAVPYPDHVEVIDLQVASWPRYAAHPLPGEPVAVGPGWAAWTERGANGEDVWVVGAAVGATEPRVLAGGPGDQHLVAGAGDVLWYADARFVWRQDVREAMPTAFPADTGFEAPLAVSADGSLACWEDRAGLRVGGDIDLRCSSGLVLERPGDQRWPSIGGGFLAWREGTQVIAGRLVAEPLE